MATADDRASRHGDRDIGARHRLMRSRIRLLVSVSQFERQALALDDDQERRARLPLLGKGAVLAHYQDRRLAAELDEQR
jgi:hypothetical protein